MTLNFPGPYEIRLFYTTTPTSQVPIQHVAKYNIDLTAVPTPGTTFNLLTVVARGGVPQTLQAYVDAWVALLRPLISSAANNSVDFAELWQYTPGTFEASFVSVYAIGLAGTSGGSPILAGENILTFRSLEGGILRMHFEEFTAVAQQARDTPPIANANYEAIRVFVEGTTNAWLARDTSYPFACIALYPGQNEALFKRRLRV